MPKLSKNRAKIDELVDRTRKYTVEEACALVRKAKFAKFDETVDLAVRLGVNPKHADQMVRGALVLPHGTGQTVRVLVFAKGEKEREAREAGADFAGSDDMVAKVSEGFMDFDRVIATPDMMGKIEYRVEKAGIVHARIGKVSFTEQALTDNAKALIQALVRAKPSTAKGTYLRSITVSSTMGPGIKIDTAQFVAGGEEG